MGCQEKSPPLQPRLRTREMTSDWRSSRDRRLASEGEADEAQVRPVPVAVVAEVEPVGGGVLGEKVAESGSHRPPVAPPVGDEELGVELATVRVSALQEVEGRHVRALGAREGGVRGTVAACRRFAETDA